MEQKLEQFETPPPQYSLDQHATHGFSSRFSLAQVAAYIVIIFSIAVYATCTLSLSFSWGFLGAYITIGLAMFISSGAATLCDPTDRVIYYYKWSRYDTSILFVPEYEKLRFCEYCDSYCWETSKHCRTCNRCVNEFDHHCIWFNNCVGRRNYIYFFIGIVSTVAYISIIIAHTFVATFTINLTDIKQRIQMGISWAMAVLTGIFGLLLINLIILHIYLFCTNQTTYEFLQRKTREEEIQTRMEVQKKAENASKPSKSPVISKESISKTNLVIVQSENEFREERIQGQQSAQRDQILKKINRQKIREEKQPETQKLPKFLKNNRSLKLLLQEERAESPRKNRLPPMH